MRIFAHRGASAQAPENTLAAFELALTQGAWWLELDVQCLEDELVVLHDDTLDRTTDGEGPLAALTLAQLRALDAGQGERVPLLRELLERLAGRAALNVELKGPGTGAPAARLLAQQVAQGRWAADAILLSAFSATAACSSAKPCCATAASTTSLSACSASAAYSSNQPSCATAVRTTSFYIFLTTKRQTAVTALACFNLDTRFIDKIHIGSLLPENGAKKSPVTDRAFIHLL